ncbi:ribosome biogenesis GTPase Der [Candidatus Uhrbacteria bacterium]|nr:ribosome biogenesis GTPase Der [Candidatus Uhrbacteria bacterium]
MTTQPMPTVALVGRTNVGKSTLFNRLTEGQDAITSKEPGTTRDRKEGRVLWRGKLLRLIDTGGLDAGTENDIDTSVIKQAHIAMKEADVVLFLVDAKTGPLPQDVTLARTLKRMKLNVYLVLNKADTTGDQMTIHNKEWINLGLGVPMAISAIRSISLGDLLDLVHTELDRLGKQPTEPSEVEAVKVAVLGRPNVGKSSLLNAIIGGERFIATPIAHTTREPNDTLIEHNGKNYLFIDTAGIRKMGKGGKERQLDNEGLEKTKETVRNADVILLVLDSSEQLSASDRHLGSIIADSRAAVIVVANKWDLLPDKDPTTQNKFIKYIAAHFTLLTWAPIIFTSAKTGQRVEKLFDLIDKVESARHQVLDEEQMENFWRKAIVHHKPAKSKGPKPPKVLGMRQTRTAPPTFNLLLKASRRDMLHPTYLRYLENRMREHFDLTGTPVRINIELPRARASQQA